MTDLPTDTGRVLTVPVGPDPPSTPWSPPSTASTAQSKRWSRVSHHASRFTPHVYRTMGEEATHDDQNPGHAHIVHTPGVVGRRPRIAGRGIAVQNIAVWHTALGLSVAEIAQYGLTLADVHAALAYYDHQAELDAQIADDVAYVAAQRGQTPSLVGQKQVKKTLAAMGHTIVYIDENAAGAVITPLRQRSIDVLSTPEAGMIGAAADAHLRPAASMGRVLYTRIEITSFSTRRGWCRAGIVYVLPFRLLRQIINGLVLVYELLDRRSDQPRRVLTPSHRPPPLAPRLVATRYGLTPRRASAGERVERPGELIRNTQYAIRITRERRMPEPIIRTEHLSRFWPAVKAVDDLSLEVPAGIVFGFLGPNGAGKTTTIHLLLGLLEPTQGQAAVLGCDTRTQAAEIRAHTGALLEFAGLYERLSAEDNLDLYGRIYHIPAPDRRARSKELLTHLDLWDRRKDPVGKWSRGMKQKLAVARALFHHPPLVFLDEPTAGFDPLAATALRRGPGRPGGAGRGDGLPQHAQSGRGRKALRPGRRDPAGQTAHGGQPGCLAGARGRATGRDRGPGLQRANPGLRCARAPKWRRPPCKAGI